MTQLMVPWSAVAMLAVKRAAVPTVRAAQGQPPKLAAGAAVGEQDQGRDNFHSVDGQGEGAGVPAGVAVDDSELAHVTIGNRASDRGQHGHGRGGSAADPLVGPLRGGRGAGHFAALRVRGLVRRTGSESPSIRMRFAWRSVRCSGWSGRRLNSNDSNGLVRLQGGGLLGEGMEPVSQLDAHLPDRGLAGIEHSFVSC